MGKLAAHGAVKGAVTAALIVGLAGASTVLTLPSVAHAWGTARPHVLVLRLSPVSRHTEIPGRGRDWRLASIRVGHSYLHFYIGRNHTNTVTFYGNSAIVRLRQIGRRAYVSAVALQGHPKLRVTYNVSR